MRHPVKAEGERREAGVGGNGPKLDELVAAAPVRSERRELRVGVFMILAVVGVLWTLFALTDAATFRGRYIVTTVVQDAGGIRKGDAVQMRGVNIGRVQRFVMTPEGVAVRLELEREYEVPSDSRIALRSNGLLGGLVAEVIPGRSPTPLEGGEVLPGAAEEGIFATAAELGSKGDAVLDRLRLLLSDPTVEAVGQSALDLQTLMAELSVLAAEQRRELAALSSSLRRTAQGVERAAGPELERSIARLDTMTARLDQTTASLGRATRSLEVVLARVERGEGTLGRLSSDDSLYVNLNRAAENLARLTADFQANPRRYINLEVF